MKPYYEQGGITIYCGDCLEVMPQLDLVFDVVVADPPYKGLKGGTIIGYQGGVAKRITNTETVGEIWGYIDWMPQGWKLAKYGMMVFCSYHSVGDVQYFCKEKAIGLITWHKRNAPNPVHNSPKFTTEFIWLFNKSPGLKWRNLKTMYDIPMLAAGCFASERILKKDGKAAHPTQKPVNLIMELLEVGCSSILDPFMGSGTTLVAAQREGRRAVGIELDEDYCKIAVDRLRQPSFFSIPDKPEVNPAEQLPLKFERES